MTTYYTPEPPRSTALTARNMALIAVGAAGLGIAAGLFTFGSQNESPAPASYVIMPESGDPKTLPPEAGSQTAPNVAMPPAVSRGGGVIVRVPTPAATAGGPVSGPKDSGQKSGAEQGSDKKDSGTGTGSGDKKKDDTDTGTGSGDKKKDDGTGQEPDKQDNGPFVPPPDVQGPLKDGSDVFTQQPDIFDRPTGPIKGTGDIYQAPQPAPIVDCILTADGKC